jgi:hypothetical protein
MSNKNRRRVTIVVMLATICGLTGWDIYAAVSPGDGDTISEVTLGFAARHLSVPFLVGGLAGHLFWPLASPPPRKWTIMALVPLCLAIIAWDALGFAGLPGICHRPALALAIGLPVGHLLWGQAKQNA